MIGVAMLFLASFYAFEDGQDTPVNHMPFAIEADGLTQANIKAKEYVEKLFPHRNRLTVWLSELYELNNCIINQEIKNE